MPGRRCRSAATPATGRSTYRWCVPPLLVGAIPRQGKTFAARLSAAGLILDPHTRLYVADFKASKDWDAAAAAHRFLSGDETAHVLALIGWLIELVAEVQGHYRRMRPLDDVTCPESKVTPAMSRDQTLDMPITALFIDEVQVPLEDRTTVRVADKKHTAGEYVGELLTWLAKKGPAAGIVLVLVTQRPDSKTIPSGLRAVLGSRFALRVRGLAGQQHRAGPSLSRLRRVMVTSVSEDRLDHYAHALNQHKLLVVG